MQKDTRNLTVSQEHIHTALAEITLAQGNPEKSIAQAAAQRAMAHLDLVVRRLEAERGRLARTSLEADMESLNNLAQRAWQGLHDVLNDWEYASAPGLTTVRNDLVSCEERLIRLCEAAPREAIHS